MFRVDTIIPTIFFQAKDCTAYDTTEKHRNFIYLYKL